MNLTEELLKNGDAGVLDETARGTFMSRQLGKVLGCDGAVEVEFKALSPRRLQHIRALMMTKDGDVDQSKTVDAMLVTIMESVTNIDFKDQGLRSKFGCVTPKDVTEKLFGNEIDPLSKKILNLSQPDEALEDEVKN